MEFDGEQNDGGNNDDDGIMIDFPPIAKQDNLDAMLAVSLESPSTPLSDVDSGISNASEESTVRASNGTLSTVIRFVTAVCSWFWTIAVAVSLVRKLKFCAILCCRGRCGQKSNKKSNGKE